MGAQSISWHGGIYDGLSSGNEDWVYHYKAFTYARYAGFFMQPLFLSGIILLLKNTEKRKKIINVSTCFMFVIYIGWIVLIQPYIVNGTKSIIFITNTVLPYNSEVVSGVWILTANLFFIMAVMWILIFKKRIMLFCYIILIYSSALRITSYFTSQYQLSIGHYNMCNQSNELLNVIKDEINISKIYVKDMRDVTDHEIYYEYQFMNYDLCVIPDFPTEEEDSFLLFTNDYIINDFENTKEIMLDGNEILYYRGYDDCIEGAVDKINQRRP